MLVPKCSWVVAAAIAPMSTQGSGHAVSGDQIGAPSGEYGYGERMSFG